MQLWRTFLHWWKDLASYELHLVKKENILFPMMEKRKPEL
jgi:iron-sulfur cluster repair protein YtfE (RIC family)